MAPKLDEGEITWFSTSRIGLSSCCCPAGNAEGLHSVVPPGEWMPEHGSVGVWSRVMYLKHLLLEVALVVLGFSLITDGVRSQILVSPEVGQVGPFRFKDFHGTLPALSSQFKVLSSGSRNCLPGFVLCPCWGG